MAVGNVNTGLSNNSMAKKDFKFSYTLVEHRPCSEVGLTNQFFHWLDNLDQRSELWEEECPYNVGTGRIVKTEDAEEW